MLLGTLWGYAEELERLPLERRGPGGDLEVFGARHAGRHGVAGDGGKIVEEGAEAVHRIAVRRSLRSRLGPGTR